MQAKKNLFRSIAGIGLIGILIAVAAACDSDVIYTENRSLPSDGWAIGDTLVFSPEIVADGPAGSLNLWVRHSKDYPYSNLWLKVISDIELERADGLVEVRLADKSGKWLGTCSQSLCTARITLKEDVGSVEPGAYKLEVLQYMREAVLPSVRNVGVEIRKSGSAVTEMQDVPQ